MKKSSIYGILSIVLIVGMFFTGCASKNNASTRWEFCTQTGEDVVYCLKTPCLCRVPD